MAVKGAQLINWRNTEHEGSGLVIGFRGSGFGVCGLKFGVQGLGFGI